MKMKKEIKLFKKEKKEIPIFFASDDNYIPFLDVAIRSLIENASKNYRYTINILNTGIKEENIKLIKKQERDYVKINFKDITEAIKPIKNKLRNVYHFSIVMYYRLFIQSLFPEYNKALYLDCDIVVLGDVSKLFNTALGNNCVGAITDQAVAMTPEFCDYVENAVGVAPKKYFNSGILVMNLSKFRQLNILDKFCYLINEYNFDTVAPDQDYLNVLCKDKVKYLPNGWNKNSLPVKLEGELNIAHYALGKKPWQFDDVINGEYFWHYAKKSPFYNKILEVKENFDDVKKAQKEQAGIDIIEHTQRILKSDKTFYKTLFENKVESFFENIVFNELDENMGVVDGTITC